MSACLQAAFETPESAKSVRDTLKRHHLFTNFYYCGKCCNFHLRQDGTRLIISQRRLQVLRMIALGYDSAEIAKELGVSVPTIWAHRKKLFYGLSAISVGHLVSIAICIGLIDPREHLPHVFERCDAAAG